MRILERWYAKNQARMKQANERERTVEDCAFESSAAEEPGFVIGNFGLALLRTDDR